MATLGTTSKPAYVYDTETDTWVPIGVGAHTHDTSALVSVNNFNAAGKNLIINGAMDFWQRGTSLAGADAGGTYFLADRWGSQLRSSQSRETDAPSGLFKYSLKLVKGIMGGALPGQFWQGVEPQTFVATGNYTLSFYAKSTSLSSIFVNILDRSTAIGEGGTTNSTIYSSSAINISSSWQRYSVTFSISSLSFTGDRIGIYIGNSSIALNQDLFLTGVQLEFGSTMTPFSRAGGTLQGELASCQRYFWRYLPSISTNTTFGSGLAISTTRAIVPIRYPVIMRSSPSFSWSGVSGHFKLMYGGYSTADVTTLSFNSGGNQAFELDLYVSSGLTTGNIVLAGTANSSAYMDLNSEL